MTEHTEKDILMKCTKCGYEEEVPRWLIDELFPNEPEEKNRLYKDHPKGFYVYAKFKSNDNDSNDASANKNSKDIQGCVNYFIRYAGRPAMAENRITE